MSISNIAVGGAIHDIKDATARADTEALKTETATVKRQVTKNTRDINILKAVTEGTLYEVDEDFPKSLYIYDDNAGECSMDSMLDGSKILKTGYVTNLIITKEQEDISHVVIGAGYAEDDIWSFYPFVVAKIPEDIREIIKDWVIIDDSRLCRRGKAETDFDLENNIKRQTWYFELFDEILSRMEFEPVTEDMLPDDVLSQVEICRDWNSCEVFRMKHTESGMYITVSNHREGDYESGAYYISYNGYFLASSESDMKTLISDYMPSIDFWTEESIEAEPFEVTIDRTTIELDVAAPVECSWCWNLYNILFSGLPEDFQTFEDISNHTVGFDNEQTCDNCDCAQNVGFNRAVVKAYIKL